MSIPEGFKLVPVELLDRALLSIMEQGFECDGLYELVHIQKQTPQPIYDEAKEREFFKREMLNTNGSGYLDEIDGVFTNENINKIFCGWILCAQSRAKSVEV